MNQQKTYSEGQFGTELSSMYFDGNKRKMMIYALLVLQSERSLAVSDLKNMVERFEQANVITSGEADKVLTRFGQQTKTT